MPRRSAGFSASQACDDTLSCMAIRNDPIVMSGFPLSDADREEGKGGRQRERERRARERKNLRGKRDGERDGEREGEREIEGEGTRLYIYL